MSETEPMGPVKIRLFVYVTEEADLQQLLGAAKSVEKNSRDQVNVEILTWPEGRTQSPIGFDIVVGVFANNAATRAWLGAPFDAGWWKRSEVWCIGNTIFFLKPLEEATSFDESLAFVQREDKVRQEVALAWCRRDKIGLPSPFSPKGKPIESPLAEALTSALTRSLKEIQLLDDTTPITLPRLLASDGKETNADRAAARSPIPGVEGIRQARLAAYGHNKVEVGRNFILDVWVFSHDFRDEAEREARRQGRVQTLGSAGPIAMEVGRTLTVAVTVPSFRVEPAFDTVVWDGTFANTSFTLCSDADACLGPQVGTALVTSGAVPVAVLRFEFLLRREKPQRPLGLGRAGWAALSVHGRLWAAQKRISTIFASYAHQDRVEVLQWARGAEVAGVDVFLDVLKNREGAEWESDLFNHVPTKDLFCLFWSAPASESKWVEMEWRCALATRGLDYIHPVPLVDPRVVPPPAELRSKHFSSPAFIAREYEKGMRPDAGV